MGSQRVRHDRVTEQQQNPKAKVPGVALVEWVMHREGEDHGRKVKDQGQFHHIECVLYVQLIRWTCTGSLNAHAVLHWNPIFNNLKRQKKLAKEITDWTPESFAAIFFFIPNMYFCKPAFPKQCKWIRSDCIDLNTCDFVKRNIPPTKIPQQKHGCISQVLEVN